MRNLESNEEIVVHGKSATDVVVLEGRAKRLDHDTAPADVLDELDAAYEDKYDTPRRAVFRRSADDRLRVDRLPEGGDPVGVRRNGRIRGFRRVEEPLTAGG
ncbi:hypothetical protein [Natrinema gelatinilyticum]|uniref:hypothetical protein n=1 Tax=Natrinema gelatinilyticum TaxID=2961571 RepID=UPI0020C58651|nr:hypothetical protein [Natrinema gelatinilyticum]